MSALSRLLLALGIASAALAHGIAGASGNAVSAAADERLPAERGGNAEGEGEKARLDFLQIAATSSGVLALGLLLGGNSKSN
ncbi:MAG: hypothetical protein WCY11_10930 [Novosphingobium sp.]